MQANSEQQSITMQGKHLSKITVENFSKTSTLEFHLLTLHLDEYHGYITEELNTHAYSLAKLSEWIRFQKVLDSTEFNDNKGIIITATKSAIDSLSGVELPDMEELINLGLIRQFGLPNGYSTSDYDDIHKVTITHPTGDFSFIRNLEKKAHAKALEILENASGDDEYYDYAPGFAHAMSSMIQHLAHYLNKSGEDATDFYRDINSINEAMDDIVTFLDESIRP